MKKTKLFGFIALLVMVVTVAVANVSLNSQNDLLDFTLAKVEVLANGENGDEPSYTCNSGGPGSSSCSASFSFLQFSTSCDVTCNSGYYACCNNYENKCQCFKETK